MYSLSINSSHSLFQEPLCDWSKVRLDFVMWCAYYYNLSTLPEEERPPTSLLDNDLMLDNWLRTQEMAKASEERKKRGQQARIETIGRS